MKVIPQMTLKVSGRQFPERKKVKPMSKVKMVMTRGQDDPKELYDLIGSKEYTVAPKFA